MSYSPTRIGEIDSLEGLREYVQEELEKISKEFNETIALDLRTVHQAPKRPREGMIVSADGTNWNPGSGAGAYEFVNGVWRRVAGVVDGDYGDITISGGVWSIDNNTVSLAKMADLATARILGRLTAGTGDPEALTGTQVTTLLDVFTSALKGLVPASGGNTTHFLCADGTFKAPPTSATITLVNSGGLGTGTNFDITSIPSHKLLLLQIQGASHNGGTSQFMQLNVSDNNGGSYPGASYAMGAAILAAGTMFQNITLGRWAASTLIVAGNNGGGHETIVTGIVNAIRLTWSGGASFDAGNYSLFAFN